MVLQALGLTDRWQALFDAAKKADRATLGRVVRQDRGFVLASTETGVVLAAIRPKADPALVGDWVVVEDEAVSAILERQSLLGRRDPHSETMQPIVANVDFVFIVCGMDRPINLRRIERALTQTQQSGAIPVVVLSKVDLVEDSDEVIKDLTEKLNVDVCGVSSHLDSGLDEIRNYMRGKTSVMIGESGAGKSTILNALLGEELVLTGEVRSTDAKGRHTTTRRELHVTSSGILIDTPGIRALGLWADEKSVAETFSEIAEVADQCRFTNCEHGGTPGCAITLALKAGEIKQERVNGWLTQMNEIKEREERKTWRRYKS